MNILWISSISLGLILANQWANHQSHRHAQSEAGRTLAASIGWRGPSGCIWGEMAKFLPIFFEFPWLMAAGGCASKGSIPCFLQWLLGVVGLSIIIILADCSAWGGVPIYIAISRRSLCLIGASSTLNCLVPKGKAWFDSFRLRLRLSRNRTASLILRLAGWAWFLKEKRRQGWLGTIGEAFSSCWHACSMDCWLCIAPISWLFLYIYT
jgi:hypothetical protein